MYRNGAGCGSASLTDDASEKGKSINLREDHDLRCAWFKLGVPRICRMAKPSR
jgi:hypothetical protein